MSTATQIPIENVHPCIMSKIPAISCTGRILFEKNRKNERKNERTCSTFAEVRNLTSGNVCRTTLTGSRNVFESLSLVEAFFYLYRKKIWTRITAGEDVVDEYRISHHKIGEQKLALVSHFRKGS